jgi:hypothetical protein
VTAAGPDDDPPWLATVFVPGPSLAEAVETAGPWPAASVWKLAAGLVEALQAVHACGLHAGNGERIWEFQAGGPMLSGIAVNGGAVYAGSFDEKVYALHAGNGSKIWDFSTEGPVESGIVIAGDTVYAGSDDGNVYAVRL